PHPRRPPLSGHPPQTMQHRTQHHISSPKESTPLPPPNISKLSSPYQNAHLPPKSINIETGQGGRTHLHPSKPLLFPPSRSPPPLPPTPSTPVADNLLATPWRTDGTTSSPTFVRRMSRRRG